MTSAPHGPRDDELDLVGSGDDDLADELADEMSEESFPGSDPPSTWAGAGVPDRAPAETETADQGEAS